MNPNLKSLTERLREIPPDYHIVIPIYEGKYEVKTQHISIGELVHEAASEIERLRQALTIANMRADQEAEAYDALYDLHYGTPCEQIRAVQATESAATRKAQMPETETGVSDAEAHSQHSTVGNARPSRDILAPDSLALSYADQTLSARPRGEGV